MENRLSLEKTLSVITNHPGRHEDEAIKPIYDQEPPENANTVKSENGQKQE